MKLVKWTGVLLALSAAFSSCYYDNVQELYGTTQCDTTVATFALQIAPILEQNCYTCHSIANADGLGGGVPLEGFDNMINYITAGDPVNSQLYADIAWLTGANPMPKGQPQISDCDLALMKKWINDGALNN